MSSDLSYTGTDGSSVTDGIHTRYDAWFRQFTAHAVPLSLLASVTYGNGREASRPNIFGTRPDGYVGRFAYTTLTPTTSSKNFVTLKAEVGTEEISENLTLEGTPLVASPLSYMVITGALFISAYTIRVSIYFPLARSSPIKTL